MNYEVSIYHTEDYDGPSQKTTGTHWLLLDFDSVTEARNHFKKYINPTATFGRYASYYCSEVVSNHKIGIPKVYQAVLVKRDTNLVPVKKLKGEQHAV